MNYLEYLFSFNYFQIMLHVCPESIMKPRVLAIVLICYQLYFSMAFQFLKWKKNTLIYVFIFKWYSSIQKWRHKCNPFRSYVISVLNVLESATPKQRYQHRNSGLFLFTCSVILQLLQRTVTNLRLPLTTWYFLVGAWRSTWRNNIVTWTLSVVPMPHGLEMS